MVSAIVFVVTDAGVVPTAGTRVGPMIASSCAEPAAFRFPYGSTKLAMAGWFSSAIHVAVTTPFATLSSTSQPASPALAGQLNDTKPRVSISPAAIWSVPAPAAIRAPVCGVVTAPVNDTESMPLVT